jgi:hypothetical protein
VWFSKKARPEYDRTLIAEIEGKRTTTDHTGGGMAALGLLVMIVAIVLESSAVRLAAWGAIWTGWNVLCAVGTLRSTQTDYVVYRVVRRDDPR